MPRARIQVPRGLNLNRHPNLNQHPNLHPYPCLDRPAAALTQPDPLAPSPLAPTLALIAQELIDAGFQALRVLGEQVARLACASDTVSHGVRVEAESGFMEGDGERQFVFTYRITITNVGDELVQLLGRQWDICDADGELVAMVPKGSPGVVGHTPILQPGQSFQYSSGTGLPTATGVMSGSFQMAKLDESTKEHAEFFDAAVGVFSLDSHVKAAPF